MTPHRSEDVEVVVDGSPWSKTLDESLGFRDRSRRHAFNDDGLTLVIDSGHKFAGFAIHLMCLFSVEVRFRKEKGSDDPNEYSRGSIEIVCRTPGVGKIEHVTCWKRGDGGDTEGSGIVREDGTTFVKEEDIVDGHNGDGFANTGTHTGDNAVSEQLFESLCNGAKGHATISLSYRGGNYKIHQMVKAINQVGRLPNFNAKGTQIKLINPYIKMA